MRLFLAWVAAVASPCALLAQTATFEGLTFSTATPFFENGANLTGSFVSGGFTFSNYYNTEYQYWSGFAYSTVNNVTNPSYTNQYAAYHLPSGTGYFSSTYAVAYNFSLGDARVNLPADTRPASVRITNTTYTALTIRDGDPWGFSRPFTDGDYFRLKIHGYNALNQPTGTVEFYLADFRNGNSLIVSEWTHVDLTTLGVDTTYLLFSLESTDNHPIYA